MPKVLFAAPRVWEEYAPHLPQALEDAGVTGAELVFDAAPESIDYIIYAPSAPLQDFAPYSRCKAVLSLWAGVERVVGNQTLTQPLCRMVDPGLAEGMVEWVTGHVLRHHLGLDRHILNPEQIWDNSPPPLARERSVVILGLGELGSACALALRALNFKVSGWSRGAKDIEGVECFAGPDGLAKALGRAEILVTLLPRTPATENILNCETLALLPKGAVIINPGRGALIDDEALLAALENNISHATLDVFRVEPLPRDHAYWAHPRVTVTPHIAADTRAVTASKVLAENIRRAEAGEPLLYQVDRQRGY